jgi:dihydrofolate reductase
MLFELDPHQKPADVIGIIRSSAIPETQSDSAPRVDALAAADEVMIIGGGQVYAEFLAAASTVYLTHVAVELDGDTRFPPLDDQAWTLESSEPHAADERHAYAFEFRVYRRR